MAHSMWLSKNISNKILSKCLFQNVDNSWCRSLTFHDIFCSRNVLLAVVVISTSLLIYVVLYKNELLSNLYVLLQVLCFTTPRFSFVTSSIFHLKNFKFDFELPIIFRSLFSCKYYKSLHTIFQNKKYLKQYFTSLSPSLSPPALLQIRPFICFGLWIDFYPYS